MRSLGKIIPISIISVLIICAILNSAIKKAAYKNSIDETLVENLLDGVYVELPNYSDTPNDAYVIFTGENIDSVIIDDVYLFTGLFGTSASINCSVNFTIWDSDACARGYLKLNYNSNSPCKWVVDSWSFKDFEIYED